MVDNQENAQAEPFNWPPLESNPEIFTDYMRQCGLPQKWTFGEIYGFEEDLLAFIPQPCLAVIINAEFLKKEEERARELPQCHAHYWMKQTGVLDNACGVIACIHAVLNNLGDADNKIAITADSVLDRFQKVTAQQSPADAATTLEGFTDFQ